MESFLETADKTEVAGTSELTFPRTAISPGSSSTIASLPATTSIAHGRTPKSHTHMVTVLTLPVIPVGELI